MTFLTRRRLSFGFLAGIALTLGLLVLAAINAERQRLAHRNALHRIDHAGRLRMLGQRAVQKAIIVRQDPHNLDAQSEFLTAVNRFETTLKALKNGDDALQLEPADTPQAISAIQLLETLWPELSKIDRAPSDSADDSAELERISAIGDEVLHASQNLVLLERQHLTRTQHTLSGLLTGSILATLALTAATFWLVHRLRAVTVAEETLKATKELLAAAQEAQTRSHALLASALDPLIATNDHGIIQLASDSVETHLGWKPEELIGQNINVLMPEPHRSLHDDYLATYRRTGESQVLGAHRELVVARQNGTTFPAVVTLWQVSTNAQSEALFMGQIRDLTAQKEAEAELRHFRAALDASPDAIFLIDRETMRFVDMNETAVRITGYSRDELLTMGPDAIKPHLSREELIAKFDAIIAAEDKMGILETIHRAKDGTTTDVEIFLRATELDHPLLIASVRDITQRQRQQAELANLNKQFVDVARKAGQAEVATSVLHNVGNVLNSVNVSATIVQDKIRDSAISGLVRAAEQVEHHLDDFASFVTEHKRGRHLPRFLIDAAHQLSLDEQSINAELTSLIDNIDHIKSIVSAQQAYATGTSAVRDEVSLSQLILDALRINTASMQRHCVKITHELPDGPSVIVDKQKLLQIVINLISNAKYACIETSRPDGHVHIALRFTDDDRACVEITDNGMGIAPKNLTRIFAHGFTTRSEGHGFGLHSAALAAKELGGSLSASSPGAGKGATFTLDIPLTTASVSEPTT